MKCARSVYPGWWLAIATSLSLGLVAGMTFWTFGLFVAPLEAEFGWSGSTIGAAMSVMLLVSGLASPLVGRLVDQYQPRLVILIGSAASVVAYLLLASVHELWQFFALVVILGFFRTWIFYVPFTTLITRWFSRRRATAMGIATSGFGLGGLIFLPLTAQVLASVGWRGTFVAAALLMVVVNGLFVVLARNDPPPSWAYYDAATGPAGPAVLSNGRIRFNSVRDIYRAPMFWLLAAGFGLFFFAQWAFLYHAPQLLEHDGLGVREAAFVLGASAGIGVVLRLVSGAFIDRIIRLEWLAAGVLGIMALALLVLAGGVAPVYLVGFVVLWGIGSGIGPSLEPMLVSRLFGRKHYPSVYGAMDGIDTLVSIPGPWLGGLVYDLSGSYLPVLLVFGGAFTVGSVGFALLRRLAPRREPMLLGRAGQVGPIGDGVEPALSRLAAG